MVYNASVFTILHQSYSYGFCKYEFESNKNYNKSKHNFALGFKFT